MTAIKAHFDGRVLVLEEPVQLPLNQPLKIYVESEAMEEAPLLELARELREMPDDPGTPADLAAQHDHYLHGLPKRP